MDYELNPRLITGKIVELNDTAVKAALKGRMGIITLPRRCVISEKPLGVGQEIQVYLSYMKVL